MKKLTYLNGVLTIIAFCLLMITLSLLNVFPIAYAGGIPSNYATIPVNKDGSINVAFVKGETIDVNIDEVGGTSQSGSVIDINIDEVGGHSTHGTIPVEVQR